MFNNFYAGPQGPLVDIVTKPTWAAVTATENVRALTRH
ncbi:hypothetical protein C791_7143 [Amycolatopsis azurea DSM 43854]|uniref:Uncharacterized protein n=1 Tax=Amycolatopsis azurea DSM 43854 TaxID=1238180 RepID=M2PGK5_9PSEU|nr:hypothetical protein C791_7143 [Amycolatopsis azurea DSM 43854]